MPTTVSDIAALIRVVDGDNLLDAHGLATELLWHPDAPKSLSQIPFVACKTFFARTNPDKRMGAGQLAELIVAEFDLEGREGTTHDD